MEPKYAPRHLSPTGQILAKSQNTSPAPYQTAPTFSNSASSQPQPSIPTNPSFQQTQSAPGTHISTCPSTSPNPAPYGPVLPPATTSPLQPLQPPILPIHLRSPRLRSLHTLTSPIRRQLWPGTTTAQQPSLRRRAWVWGSASIWTGCQWADGRARGVEDGVDSGVWDGRV